MYFDLYYSKKQQKMFGGWSSTLITTLINKCISYTVYLGDRSVTVYITPDTHICWVLLDACELLRHYTQSFAPLGHYRARQGSPSGSPMSVIKSSWLTEKIAPREFSPELLSTHRIVLYSHQKVMYIFVLNSYPQL